MMTRARRAGSPDAVDELLSEVGGGSTPSTPDDTRRLRKERALSQLREYLAYPRWRASQAVYILAGIDPELTLGGPGDWGLAWLPGGLRGNWCNHDGSVDQFSLEQNASVELQDVEGFVSGDARTPREWIDYALSNDYAPPWLEIAMGNGFIDPPHPPVDVQSAQRAGGLAARNATPQHKAKCELLKAWDRKRGDLTDPDVVKFKRNMIEIYCAINPPKASERTIRAWVSALQKELRTRTPCPWAEEIRARRES